MAGVILNGKPINQYRMRLLQRNEIKIPVSVFNLILLQSFSLVVFCQANYTREPAIGINMAFFDYKGADEIQHLASDVKSGIALHYQNSFSARFDYSCTLSGAFLELQEKKDNNVVEEKKKLWLGADFLVRARFFTSNKMFNPYVQAGPGVSSCNNSYGLYFPAGLGCQVNVTPDVFLLLNTQYRLPITNTQQRHFYGSIGIAGRINRKKIVHAKQTGVHASDLTRNSPRDTDGDGILDNLDSCPLVAGLARYAGCPAPDKDKDGVEDVLDKCPDIAGNIENFGCPVVKNEVKQRIEQAAQQIFFETGSYKLLSKSYTALNEVAQILKDDPYLKLKIEGHTDNAGTPAANQSLSEDRAAAVKNFLVTAGISENRLQFRGFGQNRPVTGNETPEGRAKNRRVVLLVY